jgi:hypothetical protein
MMKFRITLLPEMTLSLFVVLLLSGCFGDGGSGSAYDGTWTAVFADSGSGLPPAASGETVSCHLPTPLPTITLVNGIGSTSQTDPCTGTGGVDAFYSISVAITPSTGAMKAIINGGTLSGQCISTQGCAVTGTMGGLTLTR